MQQLSRVGGKGALLPLRRPGRARRLERSTVTSLSLLVRMAFLPRRPGGFCLWCSELCCPMLATASVQGQQREDCCSQVRVRRMTSKMGILTQQLVRETGVAKLTETEAHKRMDRLDRQKMYCEKSLALVEN